MTRLSETIEAFLAEISIGVVGASRSRDKYGYLVFNALRSAGYGAYPVNPNAEEIDGVPCLGSVADLPSQVAAIVIITPPEISELAVEMAIVHGMRHIWMQPGSESAKAIELANSAGISVISGGPCILVALKSRKAS